MKSKDEQKGAALTRDETDRAVLQLAAQLGNVAEACRHYGVDRSFYYRALKRKRAASSKRSPLAKSITLESKLIALCLEYPEWGCDRLAWYLTLKGDEISSPTAQKILIRHGLGRAAQRRTASQWMEEEGVKESFTVP